MSRSGYSDGIENWDLIRWRGAVNSAIKGKRGQAFLHEMVKALDAMPVKRLIAGELISKDDQVCALGAVAKSRAISINGIDPEDNEKVAQAFGIARALACEIQAENDDDFGWENCSPEERWQRMRKWVDENLIKSRESSGGK